MSQAYPRQGRYIRDTWGDLQQGAYLLIVLLCTQASWTGTKQVSLPQRALVWVKLHKKISPGQINDKNPDDNL